MRQITSVSGPGQPFLDWQKGDLLVVKMGNSAVWNISTHAAQITADLDLTPRQIHKWRKVTEFFLEILDPSFPFQRLVAIDCLCDPVKRLFSDFLHVKDEHKVQKKRPNSQFLGEDSKLYPFAGMTFGDMVLKFGLTVFHITLRGPKKGITKICEIE